MAKGFVKKTEAIWVTAILICAALLIVCRVGYDVGAKDVRKAAIERGYAQHCPVTGDFAWRGECDDGRQ